MPIIFKQFIYTDYKPNYIKTGTNITVSALSKLILFAYL